MAKAAVKPAASAAPKASSVPKMRRDTLDKSRPYGTVHSSRPGFEAAFFQDGKHYNAQGARVVMPGDPPEVVEEPVAQKAAAAVQTPQKSPDNDEGGAPAGSGDNAQKDDVNLQAWVNRDEVYVFPAVRQAILARYSKDVVSVEDAVAFLIGEGLADPSVQAEWAAAAP